MGDSEESQSVIPFNSSQLLRENSSTFFSQISSHDIFTSSHVPSEVQSSSLNIQAKFNTSSSCSSFDSESSPCPIILHDDFLTPPGYSYSVLPLKNSTLSLDHFIGLSSVDMTKLEFFANFEWDIDYFAIDLPVKSLYLDGLYPLGPKIDCISYVNMKFIQDPLVKKMKFINVISMSPILVFEDTSGDFPLRSKFFEVLNGLSSLKMCQNGRKGNGALFYQQHHIHTHVLMETLQSIGVSSLRYSMYGTKFPLKTLAQNKLLVSLFLKSDPNRSYFDVALSCPSDEIIVVNFESLPKNLPKLKTFPYFGYLFNGDSGGFSFETEIDGSTLFFKWYSLVYHHLTANSNIQWHIPDTKHKLKRKLESMQILNQKLQSSANDIGGYRVEIRYSKMGFLRALSDFQSREPFSPNALRHWLDNIVDDVGLLQFPSNMLIFETISKKSYLKYLSAMMKIAFHIPDRDTLYGGGLYHGDKKKKLDESEKKMAETLFNSFGYSSERQRRFDCSIDINDWIGNSNYGNIENWRKIIKAAEKISKTPPIIKANNNFITTADEGVIADLLSNLTMSHPKNHSKKFKAHRKGTLGSTPAFLEKRELALYVYQMMISFHDDEPKNWRKYFSSKK